MLTTTTQMQNDRDTSGNTVHTRHHTTVQNPAPTWCPQRHSVAARPAAPLGRRTRPQRVGAPTVASHTAAPLGSRTPRSAIRPPHTPAEPFGRRTPCSAIRPPHTPAAPFGSRTAQQPKSASKQQERTHHVAEPGCTSSSRGEIWMSVTGPCERSACERAVRRDHDTSFRHDSSTRLVHLHVTVHVVVQCVAC